MEAAEVINRINGYAGEIPKPRFVIDVYAEVVSRLSPALTPDQVEELVALGALVKRRSSQLVPVFNFEQVSDLAAGKGVAR